MGRRSPEQKARHAAEERTRRKTSPATDADKAKRKAYDRVRYVDNKEVFNKRSRAYQLLSKYGLTEKLQQELIAAQGHKCAICETYKPGGRGSWHTDHCHTSGVVRGMLCCKCNRGLGQFTDNPDMLRRAASYLEKDM
jgi:hypothetical protein